jgi:hypothetical protein
MRISGIVVVSFACTKVFDVSICLISLVGVLCVIVGVEVVCTGGVATGCVTLIIRSTSGVLTKVLGCLK